MLRFQASCALIILAFSLFAVGLLPAMAETGKASWYGNEHHGRRTASGERFDQNAAMCAHRSLRYGTVVKITRLSNGRTAQCTILDRGPARWTGRIIDVSRAVARQLGMIRAGVVKVNVRVVR